MAPELPHGHYTGTCGKGQAPLSHDTADGGSASPLGHVSAPRCLVLPSGRKLLPFSTRSSLLLLLLLLLL